jgi:ornithine cyclodeaminase/alanine dehydrogenase-like protein (mu-crystallin family)
MTILLREQDVADLLDMKTAMSAVEEVLRHQAEGTATNRPRYRVPSPTSQLHVMAAGDNSLGVCGLKCYTAVKGITRFLVLLYDSRTGELLTMIEADRLGQMRTGAASGVATLYLARRDADTVGIYGTGWQAESQLMAVCRARKIKLVKAYGRNVERRKEFARRMTEKLGISVIACDKPEDAARGCSIVVTVTTSREPVLDGKWLDPGTHINAAGSNFLSKREIDLETVRRSSIVVVDSIEQSKLEAGDLLPAIEWGVLNWEAVTELGRVIAGQSSGRRSNDEITLFKSNGIALEDIATALRVYELACERGVGETIEMWKK